MTTTTQQCLRCGREFISRRAGHVFCSRDCRHRFDGRRVTADPEAVARLFDAERDPTSQVKEDDWHPAPTFAALDASDTVAHRRSWFRELQADNQL